WGVSPLRGNRASLDIRQQRRLALGASQKRRGGGMVFGGFGDLRPGVTPLSGHRGVRKRRREYLLLASASSTLIRGFVWRFVRVAGITIRWALSGWRRLFVGVALLGALVVLLNALIARKWAWPSLAALLALYVLLAFL